MPATIAIVALSARGAALAGRLADRVSSEAVLYLDRRFAAQAKCGPEIEPRLFDLPLRPLLRRVWQEHRAVVLFLPVGAAVRLVAPMLEDKRSDPALVCVDDAGRFAVSVLSGHLGGADALAQRVAAALGAEAVVTSGSHVTGTLAVDLMGREFGWTIEADSTAVTRASAAMVNGEPVGVFQDAGEPDWWPPENDLNDLNHLPHNIAVHDSLESLARSGCSAALVITDREVPLLPSGDTLAEALPRAHVVLYRPRSLAAGMGCRRGVPAEELENLLSDTFRANNLSLASLACLASATLKQDEPGLAELAGKHGVPFHCYTADELNAVFDADPTETSDPEQPRQGGCQPGPGTSAGQRDLHPSVNARMLVGVWGVAEPAALLASGAGRLLVSKQTAARATIAVARIELPACASRPVSATASDFRAAG